MQRVATKTTRGPNAAEKRFQTWVKDSPCAFCGNCAPSIVDHAEGATFKHNKILIGHWFVVPKCEKCDAYKTKGNHSMHFMRTGVTHASAWQMLADEYPNSDEIPSEVIFAIADWRR